MRNNIISLVGRILPRKASLTSRKQKRLLTLSLLLAFSAIFSLSLIASAVTWSSPNQLATYNGSIVQPMIFLSLKARPTDGVAFITGSSRSGTYSGPGTGAAGNGVLVDVVKDNNAPIHLCPSNNYNCDNNGPGASASNPHIAFGSDGTGYLVYRIFPDPDYRGYLRKIDPNFTTASNPNNAFTKGDDIGQLYFNATQNYLDFPDVAVSQKSGRVFIVGMTEPANIGQYRGLGFGEYNNAASGPGSFSAVKNDFTSLVDPRNNASGPHICVDPNNDNNLHIIFTSTSNVYTVSRINGIWQSKFVVADAGATGYNYRNGTSIACGPDGNAYAVWDSPDSLGVAVFDHTKGTWQVLNTNIEPGQNFTDSAITVTPDNNIYIAGGWYLASGSNPPTGAGQVVIPLTYSTGQGLTVGNEQTAIGHGSSASQGVGIDYSVVNSRLHLGVNFFADRTSEYSYATVLSAPPMPGNLTATATNFQTIQLNWSNTTTASGITIRVERKAPGGSFADIGVSLPINTTSYSDGGLLYNSSYTYQIRYTNTSGNSPYSNTASATTLPVAYLTFESPTATSGEPGRTLAAVTVVARDATYAPITNYGAAGGQISISKGAGPGTLSGNSPVTVDSNGKAVFTNLSFDSIGSGYTLTASSGGVNGTSPSISILGKLTFSTQPVNALSKQPFNIQVSIVRPSDLSPITNYSGSAQLSIITGQTANFINASVPFSNGVATFSGFNIDTLSNNYRLLAKVINSDPVTPIVSSSFNITANIVFSSIPTTVQPTVPFTIVAQVKDFTGAIITNYNGPVNRVISGTNGQVFYGKTTVTASSGVATFNNLSVSGTGTFQVSAVLPDQLGTTTGASAITASGTPPTGCNVLQVNTNAETGDDQSNGNCTVTLRGAVSRATSDSIITFVPVLTGSQTITLTLVLNIPANVTIDAGCGPNVTIVSSGANTINFGGIDTIRGIWLKGKRIFAVSGSNGGNIFICTKETSA